MAGPWGTCGPAGCSGPTCTCPAGCYPGDSHVGSAKSFPEGVRRSEHPGGWRTRLGKQNLWGVLARRPQNSQGLKEQPQASARTQPAPRLPGSKTPEHPTPSRPAHSLRSGGHGAGEAFLRKRRSPTLPRGKVQATPSPGTRDFPAPWAPPWSYAGIPSKQQRTGCMQVNTGKAVCVQGACGRDL